MTERPPARAAPWKNRIVRYSEEDPAQLLANPFNAKIHPLAQQQALGGSLEEIGWLAPVVSNDVTGHVVDGHARIALALRRDEKTVPVAHVALTPDEEKLALAVYDPVGTLFVHDTTLLAGLLHDVQTDNPALEQMLSDLAEREGIVAEQEWPEIVPTEEQSFRCLYTEADVPRLCAFLAVDDLPPVHRLGRSVMERIHVLTENEPASQPD